MLRSSDSQTERRGTTILVVDDEPSVLALVRTMLWRSGYRVLEAAGAEEALRVAAGHNETIHLLISDVLMPDMSGYELAQKLKATHPNTRILYMSGYRDKVLVESTGKSLSDAPLLRKPFTQHNLLEKISEVLESITDPSSVQPLG